MVYHKLSHAIRARYIRFRPTAWHGHISMRVEVYGCKGNAAFSPTKLAYNFGSSLLYASKIGTCSHKKNKTKTKTKQNRTKAKQKTKKNARRPALRSYKFSVHENFLPALKIALAQKLLRQWSTR